MSAGGWLLYAEIQLAYKCRKRTGSYMPKTGWLLYAENGVAPKCRKRIGLYMVKSDKKFAKDFNRLIETMNGHPDAKFQYGIFLFLSVKKGRSSDFAKAKFDIDTLVEKLGIEAVALSNKKTKKKIKVFRYEGKSFPLKNDEAQGAWRITALVFKR